MKVFLAFLSMLLLLGGIVNAQFLIPGEGIMDVKIGADWDEVEWELGFAGFKVDKSSIGPELKQIAEDTGLDFDFVVSYQHIMWLPVSDLFFKDGEVCLVQLSSYPEYYKMLCSDIGTVEGLNFWDDSAKVEELYGSQTVSTKEEKSYYIFPNKGLGVQLFENQVRTMFIFQPQMK